MGHSTDLFDPKPVVSCICAICYDVFEKASSFRECGHTFCDACINSCLEANASCPSCRTTVTGANPNYVVRDVVDAMQVKCPERGGEGDHCCRRNKRKRGDDDDDGAVSVSGCSWKGQLKDLKEHHESVCEFKVVSCSVEGCNHSCRRKDMAAHLSVAEGMLLHMNLMKVGYEKKLKIMEKRIRADYENKIAVMKRSMHERIEIGELHSRYAHDCRNWIEKKPDALFDFSIYPIRNFRSDGYYSKHKIVGLLCYVPGPTGSVWEGAKIPATLRYNILGKEPKCKFPRGFFHNNVYPSGTICVSLLMSDICWTAETTLPEILFAIQQLLSHPNFLSPASSMPYRVFQEGGIDGYNRRAKEEADKYSGYTGHHEEVANMIEQGETVDDIELVTKAERLAGKRMPQEERPPRPEPPSFTRDQTDEEAKKWKDHTRENCECSCCAWGQTLWDDKKTMRFYLGP